MNIVVKKYDYLININFVIHYNRRVIICFIKFTLNEITHHLLKIYLIMVNLKSIISYLYLFCYYYHYLSNLLHLKIIMIMLIYHFVILVIKIVIDYY